jgi:hypothetical protein
MSQKKLKRERAANREKMKKEIQEKMAAKEKKKELNNENDIVKDTNAVVDENNSKEEISVPEIKSVSKTTKKEKEVNKEETKVEVKVKEEVKEENNKKDLEEKIEQKKENKAIKVVNKVEEDNIYKIEFDSLEEAEEYRRVARGREFCKIGCRIQDILEEEIENFKYENEKSIWNRIFKYREVRKRKKLALKMNLIEDRRTSNIRKLLYSVLRSDESYKTILDSNKVLKKAKKELLEQVREYKNKNKIEK